MADSLAYILFSALQNALQRSLKMTVDSCRLRQNFPLYCRDQLGFSNFECIEFIYTYDANANYNIIKLSNNLLARKSELTFLYNEKF